MLTTLQQTMSPLLSSKRISKQCSCGCKVNRAIIVVTSALSMLFAQSRSVTGFVYDGNQKSPLQSVNILVVGEYQGAVSKEDGSFEIQNITDESFDLSFSLIGYRDTTLFITSNETNIDLGITYLNVEILHFNEISVGAHPELEASKTISTISLSGSEMHEKMKGTLAATLSDEMGVEVGSMGQATARPVLRGYSGDRFLLTDGGLKLGDLSQTSADHAVSMDMTTAQGIEIIRGARSLIYGSNAIAGVIDIDKNSMPEVRFDHSHFHGIIGAESGNKSTFTNAVYHLPFRNNQLRFSVLNRSAGDQMTPVGVLKNTSVNNNEFFTGISNYGDKGRASASVEFLSMNYGIPGSPEGHISGVDLEMQKITQKLLLHRDIQLFDKYNIFDLEQRFVAYEHKEFESNNSYAAVRLRQQIFSLQGKLSGPGRVLGSLFQYRKFSAGGFYWTPNTDEINLALFSFREIDLRNFSVQNSFRYEMLSVHPIISEVLFSNFDKSLVKDRTFHLGSAMITLLKDWNFWTLSTSAMYTQRAPGIEDLFSDGPHLGSYSYEIGQPNLDLESTLGFELSTKYEKNKFSSTLTAFNNYSPNYHLFSKIGDGYVPGSDWIEWGSGSTGWLYKYKMKGVEANISGLEFDASYKLNNTTFSVDYSTVIGENISSSTPLPYMPASKARGRLSFSGKNNLSYTLQLVKGFDQKRLGEFEEQTDGYTCIDLYGSYSLNRKNGSHKLIFQIDNIFDQTYYNHLSRIKSIMPETGRSFTLQYRFLF